MEALVMKKVILALAVTAIVATMAATAAPYEQALVYKFSDQVNIFVTSAPCSIQKYSNEFPYAAKAIRNINGKIDYLYGCFSGKDDVVVIQWQDINGKPSDLTIIPANLFEDIKPEQMKELL